MTMSHLDEISEILITRKLDGELSSDDLQEFNRRLEEDPAFRDTWEEMSHLNDLASNALLNHFPITDGTDAAHLEVPQRVESGSANWNFVRKVAPLAFAACVALVFFVPTRTGDLIQTDPSDELGNVEFASMDDPGHHVPDSTVFLNPTQAMPVNALRPVQIDPNELRQARTNRTTNSEWIGVRGEDGRIYWVEVKHARTLRRPGLTGGAKLAGTHY